MGVAYLLSVYLGFSSILQKKHSGNKCYESYKSCVLATLVLCF